MKVHEALQQLKDTGPAHPTCGICLNVEELLDHPASASYEAWRGEYPRAVMGWVEYSGNTLYPVPVGRSRRSAREAYLRRKGLWVGAYGAARLRLLQHLINWFKERDL